MFKNYQNIDSTRKPNNICYVLPRTVPSSKLFPLDANKQYEEYDTKGNLVGYHWYFGETLNLEFNIDGEITIESDAIIYKESGMSPTIYTVGQINQRAYNIVDLKSWTCTGVFNNKFLWTQDEEFTYDETSTTSLYISAEEYLKNKKLLFRIYNFRHEIIYETISRGTTKFIFPITDQVSSAMRKGVYYCSLTVIYDNIAIPIFTTSDCILSVR